MPNNYGVKNAFSTISTTLQSGATATGNGTALDTNGFSTVVFLVTGISGDTITFEASNDGGTTWSSLLATQVGAAAIASTATANGHYRSVATGLKSVRARISTYSAGTITVVAYATTATAANKVMLALAQATENHIGEVAGSGKTVKVAQTVSTSPAYSSGDAIGGKITLANAVRVTSGESILASIHLLDRANQKPTGTIYLFDADPTNATITDNAAFVFSTDDLKVVASIPVASSDWITTNSKATANLRNLGAVLAANGGTSLYAAFVTTSTPTFAATTDLQIIFDFVYVN